MRTSVVDQILAASAPRTASPTLTPASFVDRSVAGIIVVVVVTSAGTGSITATIEGFDSASGTWYTILASAAITTNSTNVIAAYPGANVVANSRADLPMPRTFRVTITHNNANTITYSVGAALLPRS